MDEIIEIPKSAMDALSNENENLRSTVSGHIETIQDLSGKLDQAKEFLRELSISHEKGGNIHKGWKVNAIALLREL